MEKREARRDRDWRYGARVRKVCLRSWKGPEWVGDKSPWHFRKDKSLGCRGSKKGAAGTSKLGSCCKGGFELRPTVAHRHDARRLCRDWERWGGAWDDFCESRRLGRWRRHGLRTF